MVRYVFNCWRDRNEMLLVRQQLYPHAEGDEDDDAGDEEAQSLKRQRRRVQQQEAVARVSMWMSRQHCSHMVESTALLTAALLSDDDAAVEGNAWATYAVRATYATAFSRFVTGLLDGHQDKLRKQSMYSLANKIGLPASFVELRHQSTHEQLPSRAKLRSMAIKALQWIWNYYWKNLDATYPQPHPDPCRAIIVRHLSQGDHCDASRLALMSQLQHWDLDRILDAIAKVQATLPGNQIYLRCLELSRHVVAARNGDEELLHSTCAALKPQPVPSPELPPAINPDQTRDPPPAPEPQSEQGPETVCGWSLYEGPWKPKPIGLV
ncbi:hypothetical protein CDD81_2866 [Ophiocordyceps australis]|uniref:Pre-rRNA-processing protein las1 n=1 Tax=Ophiocordyceps australis TaxID=1399860 RepID=A0A2C5X7E9_9HYPO|nr:hypothetical protein CDD81_2866 [Ophiocordyceps australis]